MHANREPKRRQTINSKPTKPNQTKLRNVEQPTTQQPVRTDNNKGASGSKKINTYSKNRVENKICQKYSVIQVGYIQSA